MKKMNVLNNMNYMDTYNAITGAVVAFLSFIFGEHWFLFAAFLVTTYLGWFVLASLLVNEIRSILENFVEAGYNVPAVLTKGLEVADKLINKESEEQ